MQSCSIGQQLAVGFDQRDLSPEGRRLKRFRRTLHSVAVGDQMPPEVTSQYRRFVIAGQMAFTGSGFLNINKAEQRHQKRTPVIGCDANRPPKAFSGIHSGRNRALSSLRDPV